MKKVLFFFLFLFVCSNFAQEVYVGKDENTIINNPKWAKDVVLYDNEPLTKPAGIYANDTFYVAISDTQFTSQTQLLSIRRSTDQGITWFSSGGLYGPRLPIYNMKFIKDPDNNIYWVGRIGPDVYIWNINTPNLAAKNVGGEYDIDFEITSKNSWILYADSAGDNIYRYLSIDKGLTWSAHRLVGYGTKMHVIADANRDTLMLLYREKTSSTLNELNWPMHLITYIVNSDSTISPTVPNGLVVTDTLFTKSEFKLALLNNELWVFNTQDSSGNIDIKIQRSTNRGLNFEKVNSLASSSIDEYWFDAQPYGQGIDFIYYVDSLQTGPANSNTDYISYSYAYNGNNWMPPTKISENFPFWSPRSYSPIIIERGNSDCALVYVGRDSVGQIKLFFDRYLAQNPVNVENEILPSHYSLTQNYPNPFNPSTTIKYSIPRAEKVRVTVYNILGKQVADLVNEYKEAGSYQINFNADNLSSGTYFYKIQAGSFTETKKMLLLK
ncbi:MAG TPA: T9SS type A sorting domain-containing protein [Ignavibacteriaceae bacterium]|nr:T9SS type A sorting domain-containing protein [Ignavibacteriaceae bacterium]